MDPQLADLARTAGSTVVGLMATDAWQRTRDGIVALWRRVQPDRADAVGSELEATRVEVLEARSSGDARTEHELDAEWSGRMRRFLAAEPDIADELRRILDEVSPAQPQTNEIHLRAQASGQARVYQAGRDQHITER